MEDRTFVVQRLSLLSHSFLPSAQSSEVLYSDRDCISEQTHNNTSTVGRSFNLHIEEDLIGNVIFPEKDEDIIRFSARVIKDTYPAETKAKSDKRRVATSFMVVSQRERFYKVMRAHTDDRLCRSECGSEDKP